MKFINVISVSDGNEKDLELTIKSVRNQNYNFYKHIVIAKKLLNESEQHKIDENFRNELDATFNFNNKQ